MSHIPAETLKVRQDKLRAALKTAGLQAMALNPGPTLLYLTGMEFHLSERPVVAFFPAEGTPVLALPELEAAKTDDLSYDLQAFTYPENPVDWLAVYEKTAQAAGLRDSAGNVGIEDRTMRMLEIRLLNQAAPDVKFVTAEPVIAQLRMIKDDAERSHMQAAATAAQKALVDTLPLIKIGMTEQEVAAELSLQLFRANSGVLPFQPIIASGPQNSANPHAFPTNRKLAGGDLLVIDWGASVNGYFSDITRTFAIGEVIEELALIHKTVVAANQAAHAAAGPGVACGAVDKAARDVIEAAGYGQYFTHRLGHGLGMEGHEPPYMRGDNMEALQVGMTFTIEPGIYIYGKGGVRVEDDVIVTSDGIHSFTDLPREMQTIGS